MGTDFTVDARALTKTGGPHVKARVVNPSGAKTDTYVTDHGDGTYRVDYTPYEDGEGSPATPKTPGEPKPPPQGPQHPPGNPTSLPDILHLLGGGPQRGTPPNHIQVGTPLICPGQRRPLWTPITRDHSSPWPGTPQFPQPGTPKPPETPQNPIQGPPNPPKPHPGTPRPPESPQETPKPPETPPKPQPGTHNPPQNPT